MSSTLRKFSQIPVRSKYLLGIGTTADPNGSNGALFGNGGASLIKVTGGAYTVISPTATTAQITAAAAEVGATISTYLADSDITGKLFKDLGRTVTVYDDTLPGNLHIATYRECQLVLGADYEGVDGSDPEYSANIYVRVWAADGTGVAVARTG